MNDHRVTTESKSLRDTGTIEKKEFFKFPLCFIKKSWLMTVQELRQRFHYLIDNIEDENLLKGFYEVLYQNYYEKDTESEGDFWEALTDEQKEELLEALKESEKEENLIPHEQVIDNARQWLSG